MKSFIEFIQEDSYSTAYITKSYKTDEGDVKTKKLRAHRINFKNSGDYAVAKETGDDQKKLKAADKSDEKEIIVKKPSDNEEDVKKPKKKAIKSFKSYVNSGDKDLLVFKAK